VPGLDADDLFLIEKYGRWSFAELFAREHPRASDGHHQLVILLAPSPVKAGPGLVDHMAKVLRGHVVTNAASDEHNDRGIAGISEHRGEVENHIDRQGRVREQKADSDTDANRNYWMWSRNDSSAGRFWPAARE
jgi:hypothetical protein